VVETYKSNQNKEIMKKVMTIVLALAMVLGASAKPKVVEKPELKFDASKGEARVMTMANGQKVNYTAYEGMLFVTNVEDSAYQTINVYVPEGATQQTPILLRTYVGGYMASKAQRPKASDAAGRALQEGYVVAIPGSRGRNSTIIATKTDKKAGVKKGQTIYTGRAPAAILDLKAAIRYLRHFDKEMAGDAERIITDGTSAGGAMSSLMGATGNNPAYEPLLRAMGAADERDDVFASVCFCPITDLDHADMAYEWLYNGTDSRQKGNADVLAVSDELKAQFPAYLESLRLKTPDGMLLTADNYLDYIKSEIIRSAQIAKNAGADIPDSIGFVFSKEDMGDMPPINGGMTGGMKKPQGDRPPMMRGGRGFGGNKAGDYIVDLDMAKYLNYVVSTQPLKTAPAFDTKGVAGQNASGENEEFGDANGSNVNFTEYGCMKNGTQLTDAIRENARLLNSMNFIGDEETDVAPHWYIRHGARDRDTSFPIPLNLALKLQNAGKDVNFLLAWNRPHSGDYALDELFQWIRDITTPKSDALQTIMTRTSIRQYTNQPVTKETVEKLLRAGMAAPTAVNAQPWHFVAITDKAKLAELAGTNRRGGMIKQAALAIVVCGDMDKAMKGKGQEYWIQDCSAATENILLAAHALSLGAVWTGLHPMEDRVSAVKQVLKIPETMTPLCTIVIGYPAENPTPKDKWKPENVSYNEFGGKAE
jgi:nitroreductase/dienelactone hydrolase